jgi:phage terminase large subunit-like protein
MLDHWGGDRLVAESNYGGAMVESTIRNVRKNAPVTMVSASRGKILRAEPIKALYEKDRVRHLGSLPGLESEMSTYTGDPGEMSPNRLDAMVWGMTDLSGAGPIRLRSY